MGIKNVRVPRYRAWFLNDQFFDDTEVYQLEDTVGFRPSLRVRQGINELQCSPTPQ
jgi:hypothetical protein